MYPCQHNFFISICCKTCNLFHHIRFLSASDPASGIRYNTVTAELVTSVLHFDIRPRMFRSLRQMKRFILLCVIDIEYFLPESLLAFLVFSENTQKILLLIIANHNVNAGVYLPFLLHCLDVTSCCHHHCIRIHFFRFVKHLA